MAEPVATPRKIAIVTPDGSTYLVPEGDVPAALERGARLESPEELRTREVEKRQEGREVRTAIEGFLEGSTMGLSSVALAIGGEGEGAAERREAFPDLSTGFQVIGGLTGLGKGGAAKTVAGRALKTVSAPARLVTRAGTAVERGAERLLAPLASKGLAGKMAAKGLSVGAGAGVEGAMVGAQQWMTEGVLGETEPTAEALLDHVGVGAMFGGLLGGGLGVVGEGAAAGLTRGAKALRGIMPEGKALEEGVTDLWAKGAHMATNADEDAARAVISQRDAIPAAMRAPEELAARMAKAKDEFSELFGDLSSNHKGPKKLSFEEKVTAADGVDIDVLTDRLLGLDPANPGLYRRAEAALQGARNTTGEVAGQGQLRQLDEILAAKIERAGSGKLSAAELIKDADDFKRTVASIRRKFDSADPTMEVQRAKEILDQEFYAPLRDTLQDPNTVGKTFAAMQTEVNAPFSKQLELSGAQATSGMVKRHGKHGFLTEEAAMKGEIVWRHDPGAMQGFFKGLGEDPNSVALAREIVEELPKRQMATLEAIAKHYDLGEAGAAKLARARELATEMDDMLKKGQAAGVLRRQVADVKRATQGTGINVGSGTVVGGLLGGPIGAAAGALVGALFDPVRAAQQLSTVQRLLGAQRLDVVRRVGGYVKKATKGAARAVRHVPVQGVTRVKAAETRKARTEAYRRRLSGLTRAVSDPVASQDALISSVRGIDYGAPRLAQALQTKGMQVAAFLHAHAPKPVRAVSPFTKRDEWQPSESALERYESLERVALKPSAVLDDLERGTLTGEQVAAVRELHPHVYRQIVSELTDRLSELSEDLPYEERVRLTVLFGVPVEPAASPEMLAVWQETHAAGRAQEQAAQQRAPMTVSATKSVDKLADASMTSTQRLEAKA